MSPHERIANAIRTAARGGSPALVAYLTAGFPRRADFGAHLAAVAAAADVVEIGVPFTDPMADGVTIQRASMAALAQGVSLRWILEELARLRPIRTPLVLMSYLNPLLAFGVEALAASAARAGTANCTAYSRGPVGCSHGRSRGSAAAGRCSTRTSASATGSRCSRSLACPTSRRTARGTRSSRRCRRRASRSGSSRSSPGTPAPSSPSATTPRRCAAERLRSRRWSGRTRRRADRTGDREPIGYPPRDCPLSDPQRPLNAVDGSAGHAP